MSPFQQIPAELRKRMYQHLELSDLINLASSCKQLKNEVYEVLTYERYAEIKLMQHTLGPAVYLHSAQVIDAIKSNDKIKSAVLQLTYADHIQCSCDERCRHTLQTIVPVLVNAQNNYEAVLAKFAFLSKEEIKEWRADIAGFNRETTFIILLHHLLKANTLEIMNIGGDPQSKLSQRLQRVVQYMKSHHSTQSTPGAQQPALFPALRSLAINNAQGGGRIEFELLSYPTLTHVVLKGAGLSLVNPNESPSDPAFITSPVSHITLEDAPCSPDAARIFNFIQRFPNLVWFSYTCERQKHHPLFGDSECTCKSTYEEERQKFMELPGAAAYLEDNELHIEWMLYHGADNWNWRDTATYGFTTDLMLFVCKKDAAPSEEL